MTGMRMWLWGRRWFPGLRGDDGKKQEQRQKQIPLRGMTERKAKAKDASAGLCGSHPSSQSPRRGLRGIDGAPGYVVVRAAVIPTLSQEARKDGAPGNG